MARTFLPKTIDTTLTTTTTTVADTYLDVAGSTMTLTEGTWDVVYDGNMAISNSSGAVRQIYGNIRISDAAGTLLDNSLAFFGANMPAAAASVMSITRIARVVVPVGTTLGVKLVIRCSDSTATGSLAVLANAAFTGGLTDPDSAAKFYARRVG